MPATKVDISAPHPPLDPFFAIDSNILLNAYSGYRSHSSGNHITLARQFVSYASALALQDEVMPVVPIFVFEECIFKILQQKLADEAHANNAGHWSVFYKSNRHAVQQFVPDLRRFHQYLLANQFFVPDPEDLIGPPGVQPLVQSTMNYIQSYNLLPKDAAILAEAERLGITMVATFDGDMDAVDGITVVTTI